MKKSLTRAALLALACGAVFGVAHATAGPAATTRPVTTNVRADTGWPLPTAPLATENG